MDQTSKKTTQIGQRELIKLFALLMAGLSILYFGTLVESRYNTQQLTGVLISSVRGIKFLSQSKKDSRTPHYRVVSLALGINWLLLAIVGIVFEINHQFSVFTPVVLVMWRYLLLGLIVLMVTSESVYDIFRSQVYENRNEKKWFYWAIAGKIIGILGLLLWLSRIQFGLQENSPVIIGGITMIVLGIIVWGVAHYKQPKDSNVPPNPA